MRKLSICVILLIMIGCSATQAQQWGLYTLYATKNGTQTYLCDTNGTNYHTWTFTTATKNAYSTYLKVPGDTLVRTYKPTGNTTWNSGGIHGGIQKVLWDGTVVWNYTYYGSTYSLHHDICPLPNGNVLMICYETKTSAEATQAGSSSASAFWSEKVIEVKPTGATTGTIVWEWHLWDHLCQNYNAAKDNYVTSIINNPQLLNINYTGTGSLPDRYHMNGIDYNEDLDQIILSMHFMNSVFVIDHSTTTAEAAGHTGGNAGHGGDYLYRWGNPASYGATGTTMFNTIHDAHWVSSNNPNYPDYMCGYKNNTSTPNTQIVIWEPPYNGANYSLTVGQAYTPASYDYQFTSTFQADNEGNSQQLPNGNMLVNNAFGSVYEVNAAGTQLWTKSNTQSSHAYRFTLCEVRGPIATASETPGTVCAGSSISLTSAAASVTETSPTYTYAWTSVPAGFTSSSQNPTTNPTAPTTYTVVITNTALGCSSSASVSVNVNSLPAVPVVSQLGSDLYSTSANAYQWYLNGGTIGGATSQSYTPVASGSFTVVVTDANGCSSTSAPFSFAYTGFENLTPEEIITLIPNPTTGMLTLSGVMVDQQDFTVEIFSIFGKNMMQLVNVKNIDLSSFADGMYLVVIKTVNSITVTKKIILHK